MKDQMDWIFDFFFGRKTGEIGKWVSCVDIERWSSERVFNF